MSVNNDNNNKTAKPGVLKLKVSSTGLVGDVLDVTRAEFHVHEAHSAGAQQFVCSVHRARLAALDLLAAQCRRCLSTIIQHRRALQYSNTMAAAHRAGISRMSAFY